MKTAAFRPFNETDATCDRYITKDRRKVYKNKAAAKKNHAHLCNGKLIVTESLEDYDASTNGWNGDTVPATRMTGLDIRCRDCWTLYDHIPLENIVSFYASSYGKTVRD